MASSGGRRCLRVADGEPAGAGTRAARACGCTKRSRRGCRSGAGSAALGGAGVVAVVGVLRARCGLDGRHDPDAIVSPLGPILPVVALWAILPVVAIIAVVAIAIALLIVVSVAVRSLPPR